MSTHSTRRSLLTLGVMLAACGEATGTPDGAAPARIRIVNSVFQGATPATSAPIAIDVLVDSSDATPGAAGLVGPSVAMGETPTRHASLTPAIHSFVVRAAGDVSPTGSLFTTTNTLGEIVNYLPRQAFARGFAYTLVVAGVVTAARPVNANSVLFVANVDDTLPPPRVKGALQSRFKVVNAAPFASVGGTGATVSIYLADGAGPAPSVTGVTTLAALTTAPYRTQSVYMNVDAGSYWLTIAAGTNVLFEQQVALGAGEVRAFILQSTAFANPPARPNHVVVSLLDAAH